MIYKFKSGNTYRGVDAKTVGDELERIRLARDGRLVTGDVVEASRPETAPLHSVFTWDDEKAAEAYRHFEARHLIREVVVVTQLGQAPKQAYWSISIATQPADESDPLSGGRFYQSAVVVAADPDVYYSALEIMLRKMESAQHSLEQLQRLAPKGVRTKVRSAGGHLESAHQVLTDLAPKV